MANRRNSKKKANKNEEQRTYPNPRMSLWLADSDRNYDSSGVVQFTKEQVEKLSELFDNYAEEGGDGVERLQVRFFLYENERGGERSPDETGNLSYTLLEQSDDD